MHEILISPKDVKTQIISTFTQKCLRNCLAGENIILCGENDLSVANFKGVVKNTQTFAESEGKLVDVHVSGTGHLVLWTKNNYLRIFDLSRREPKQVGVTRRFEDSTGPLGELF